MAKHRRVTPRPLNMTTLSEHDLSEIGAELSRSRPSIPRASVEAAIRGATHALAGLNIAAHHGATLIRRHAEASLEDADAAGGREVGDTSSA